MKSPVVFSCLSVLAAKSTYPDWRRPGRDLCRIGNIDFSTVGAVHIPATDSDSGAKAGWEVSLCKPIRDLCPDFPAGNVHRASCQGNETDSFNTTSVVLAPNGLDFTFSALSGDTIYASIQCDPDMEEGFVAPKGAPSVRDGKTELLLASACACVGGCGAPVTPMKNRDCGWNTMDLSSVIPATFRASAHGWDSSYYYFSPCAATNLLCPQLEPAFLQAQRGSQRQSHCDEDYSFTRLSSFAALQDGTEGVEASYREDGRGRVLVASIRCDKNATPMSLDAVGKPREVEVVGNQWTFNFTSRCACAGDCPSARDYWARGPGQQTVDAGEAVDYPEGYTGRNQTADGRFFGFGITEQECAGACDAVAPDCGGFTYSLPNNGTCFLQSTPKCETAVSAEMNWTTFWPIGGDCEPPVNTTLPQTPTTHKFVSPTKGAIVAASKVPFSVGSCNEEQKCVSGQSVGRISDIRDHTTCCSICEATPECVGFNLLINESVCDLKSHLDADVEGQCTSGKARIPTTTTTTTTITTGSTTSTTTTTTTTTDVCFAAGMHFSSIPPFQFSLPLQRDNSTVEQEWKLSLCGPWPQSECSTKQVPFFLQMKSHFGRQDCEGDVLFGKTLNFSVGSEHYSQTADFIFEAPGVGLARVELICDATLTTRTPQPGSYGYAVANGSAPATFYQLKLRSRCACPGLCGAHEPPIPDSVISHIDERKFKNSPPARFSIPINLTDGWFNGTPSWAPPGLWGNETNYVFSVSPFKHTTELCDTPQYIHVRPDNASWCGSDFLGVSRRLYWASKSNVVEFRLEDAHVTATVRIQCSGAWTQDDCQDTLHLDTHGQPWVELTGNTSGEYHYQLDFKSQCACDRPPPELVRYHCVKETKQCVEQTRGHSSMAKCVQSCGDLTEMAFIV